MKRLDVFEVRIVLAEMAFEKRIEEAPLEVALRCRSRQRQRGEQRQVEIRMLFGVLVDGVEQDIRLAEPQRGRQAQVAATSREDALDAGVDRCEEFGHCVSTHGAT